MTRADPNNDDGSMDIILDSIDRESNSAQLIGNAGGSDVAVMADGFSSATGNEIP